MSTEWSDVSRRAGLLVDTNLFVLLIIGEVNPRRIGTAKRVASYTEEDYHLLASLIRQAAGTFTVAHVLAEVSNLALLPGNEMPLARAVLRARIKVLTEPIVTSEDAAQDAAYLGLGLTDAAIALTAERYGCAVLTDDLDLYQALQRRKIPSAKFTHLRAALL